MNVDKMRRQIARKTAARPLPLPARLTPPMLRLSEDDMVRMNEAMRRSVAELARWTERVRRR